MSGTSTFHGILLTFAILAALGGTIVALFAVPATVRSMRANKAALASRAAHALSVSDAYRKNVDAVNAMIVELEANPATYETFPQSVREQLFAAHDAAASIERK